MNMVDAHIIEHVPVDALHERLPVSGTECALQPNRSKPLTEWVMEEDDAPILREIYRLVQPHRHLEFGTWRGAGTVLCLENSPATVWTINCPDGETTPDGRWAYDAWLDDVGAPNDHLVTRIARNGRTVVRTDARGMIGTEYLSRNLGHRVCQIFADSREWDDHAYPDGFFDSVLIDGGHDQDVVENDTRKALRLVRSGGIILWHDFCPHEEVHQECPATRGVFHAIVAMQTELTRELRTLFWVDPSWVLVGVKPYALGH